jgi:release factor glutamine methyltransferase
MDARRALLPVEGADMASQMARTLLCHVSGKTHEQILAGRDLYASEAIGNAMEEGVNRLLKGEPLAYILGEWSFYGMTLYVDQNVLIPRDDTCAVTQLAIKRGLYLEQDPRILDLCTGSGCIGLAVAKRVKDARVTLADISKEALAVAKKNVNRHQLTNRVACVQADALQPAPDFLGKFDMIVSNPPYITSKEMTLLDTSVKDYEPHLALHGGEDGLDFYRSIATNYKGCLKKGGYLCLEYDPSQGDDICKILEENGFTVLERVQDFNDRERALLAQWKED